MNKKGFTLVELLGVISVLAILALVTTIVVDKSIQSFKTQAYNSQINTIKLAIDNWKIDNSKLLPKENESIYITLKDLKNSNLLDKDLINPKTKEQFSDDMLIKITNSDGYKYDILIDKTKYVDSILNGADPILDSGMIPVYYDGTTLKKADISTKWYDYSNKIWANAILVSQDYRETLKSASSGTAVDTSKIMAYFVWIPRYKYALPTGGTNAEISIVFETKQTPKSEGIGKGTDYYSHPAFKFGDVEENGFWVGKFETTGTPNSPTILPNELAQLKQNVSTEFAVALKFGNRSFNNSVIIDNKDKSKYGLSSESRMMKSDEWGAVAYLARSKYGKNTEVRINNSSTHTTGCAATNADEAQYNGCENVYNTTTGVLASTTGNITGIYDMSGGSYEYVMGYLSISNNIFGATNTENYSGFTGELPSKYWNDYTTLDSKTACDGKLCKGHICTTETTNWFTDGYFFLTKEEPWVYHGGSFSGGIYSGIFQTSRKTGAADDHGTFRVVVSVTQ